MSWGYKVIIILIVIVSGIATMVGISMNQTNEMVDANYYEKELVYQEIIDAKNNLKVLRDSVRMSTDGEMVRIQLPYLNQPLFDSGHIEFLRLSNSSADQRIEIKQYNGAVFTLPLTLLSKGIYRVRMDWMNGGKRYYHEQDFRIQ